jgi:hypothetical protein
LGVLITSEFVDSIRFKCFEAFKTQLIKAIYVVGPLDVDTKEGSEFLPYGEEAWLATAFENDGENWFIHPEDFYSLYEQTEETDIFKRPADRSVVAFEMDDDFQVKVSWLDALLNGKKGDYLVEYGPGDFNIVERATFLNSYKF